MAPSLRRLGAGVAVALVAGLLAAAVVDDVHVQVRAGHSQSQMTTTRSMLQRADALMATTTTSLRRSEQRSATAQKSLTAVTAELTTARQQLRQAQSGSAARDIELSAVHACAGGVNRSASDLKDGHQAQAVAALTAVAPACENMLGSAAGGPVYPYDFADPDVLVVKGTYFAYGTNSTAGNIQIMESTDLTHWKKAGDALPALPSWASPGNTWAPAVLHLKRTYLLYYTAATAGAKVQCLSVASARRPQGPFVDSSTAPLACQSSLGGSIDPSPYVDGSGQPYLVWKSIGGTGPATIWAQALDAQGTALVGPGPSALLRPTQSWEGSVVEAPTMTDVDGTAFLFYSGNNWNSANYAVGVARCAGALGPCTEVGSGPVLASESGLVGPGSAAVFTDDQGHLQMAFDAWLPGAVGYPHSRLLFMRPLVVTDGVPRPGPAS